MPLNFLMLLGLVMVVAVLYVIGYIVLKQRRVRRLQDPRRDHFKK